MFKKIENYIFSLISADLQEVEPYFNIITKN